MEKTILFVYGTLKRGLANHNLLAREDFLRTALTEARYRLLDLGPHPGLIVDEQQGLSVHGELWAVSDSALRELDAFEEVPGPFIRAEVRLVGLAEPAQAYFWNSPIPAGVPTGNQWPMP
jgi:gamma-glutamylaminecyclotransferase